jgi:hypothetical protein
MFGHQYREVSSTTALQPPIWPTGLISIKKAALHDTSRLKHNQPRRVDSAARSSNQYASACDNTPAAAIMKVNGSDKAWLNTKMSPGPITNVMPIGRLGHKHCKHSNSQR